MAVIGKLEVDGDAQPGLKHPSDVLECEDGSVLVVNFESNTVVR